MQLTIEISEQQEKFLRQFATNQAPDSVDNVWTRKPLHIVQTREDHAVPEGCGDYSTYIYCGVDEFDTLEEFVESVYEDETLAVEIVPYDKARERGTITGVDGEEHVIYDELDYLRAYNVDSDELTTVEFGIGWRDVAYFWTLAEARRYIKYQGHNLRSPRTYTVGMGYSNRGDYEPFWDLLMAIGQQLLGHDCNGGNGNGSTGGSQ